MDYVYGVANYSFIDSYWSAVHFGSGILLGLFIILLIRTVDKKRYYTLGLLLLVLWEAFEFFLRILGEYFPRSAEKLTMIPDAMFETESAINIFSDLLLGMIGMALVYWLLVKQSGVDPDNTEYYLKKKDSMPPPPPTPPMDAPPDIHLSE